MRSRLGGVLAATAILVGACGGAGSPTANPTPTPSPSIVTPAPSPIAVPTPMPTAVPPSASPAPTPESSASGNGSIVTATSLPVRANAAAIKVRLAPGVDGRLFAAVPAKGGTVLALLEAKGNVRSGWPVLLKGAADCEIDADPADGSVRAVCAAGEVVRAYALDADGRLMDGWPADLRGGSLQTYRSDGTRIVDGDLYVLLLESRESGQAATVTRVSAEGTPQLGVTVPGAGHSGCCSTVGPDGTAYLLGDDSIWAIDLEGVRPGFPVRLDGWPSSPSFGPEGRLYVAVDDPDASDGAPSSEVVAITKEGGIAPGWPVTIPIETWTAFGDPTGPALPPVVTSDGSVVVTGWVSGRDGTIAYAVGPSGAQRPGWPYRSGEFIKFGRPSGFTCSCEPCVTPDNSIETPPLAGPGGSLLLVQLAHQNDSGGNRIVAVRPDGKARDGWPVTLSEKGSWFASIAGTGRSVYGYAVEPARSQHNRCGETYTAYSGTVVALDAHGDTMYSTTLVTP